MVLRSILETRPPGGLAGCSYLLCLSGSESLGNASLDWAAGDLRTGSRDCSKTILIKTPGIVSRSGGRLFGGILAAVCGTDRFGLAEVSCRLCFWLICECLPWLWIWAGWCWAACEHGLLEFPHCSFNFLSWLWDNKLNYFLENGQID